MCYNNCPYERFDGSCKGRGYNSTAQPHCYEEDDWQAYKESRDDDRIALYDNEKYFFGF